MVDKIKSADNNKNINLVDSSHHTNNTIVNQMIEQRVIETMDVNTDTFVKNNDSREVIGNDNNFKNEVTNTHNGTIEDKMNMYRMTEEDKQTLKDHGRDILYSNGQMGSLTQYGGDQNFLLNVYRNPLSYSNFRLVKEQTENIIRKYFPNMTDEELLDYLNAMGEVGCGYVSIANYVWESYIDKPDQFEKDFGFPMCYKINGVLVPTQNFLFADIYCKANKYGTQYIEGYTLNYFTQDVMYRGKEAIGISYDPEYYPGSTKYNLGTNAFQQDNILKLLNSNISMNYIRRSTIKTIKDDSFVPFTFIQNNNSSELNPYIDNATVDTRIREVINNDGILRLGASDYTLYYVDSEGNRNTSKEPDIYKNAPHSMTITGMNANGDYLVSTWGGCYALDPKSLDQSFSVAEVKFNGGSE